MLTRGAEGTHHVGHGKPGRSGRSPQSRRVLQIVLGVVAIVFLVDAVAGDRGLLAMLRARREYDELVAGRSPGSARRTIGFERKPAGCAKTPRPSKNSPAASSA